MNRRLPLIRTPNTGKLNSLFHTSAASAQFSPNACVSKWNICMVFVHCALAANQSVDCYWSKFCKSVKQGIQSACIRCLNAQEISL